MNLQGKRVAILATDMFEESELVKPRAALEAEGATTAVLAPHEGEIQGARHFDKGIKVKVDGLITDARPSDYDAVLLPGGALNADKLRSDPDAQSFVRSIDANGKPIAVICHAPWLLVSAGLVRGRNLTSYYTIADDLINAGAEWRDEPVVTDHNLVSSRQPDDIPLFNAAMVKLFAEVRIPTFREILWDDDL